MEFRVAMPLLVLVTGCSSAAITQNWGDGGADQPAVGGGSSSGQPSGSGSGGGSGGGTASAGSTSGSSSGTVGSADAASASGSGAGSPNSLDAASADATRRDSSAAGEGGAADAPPGAGGDASDPLAAARAQCVQIINQDRATLSPPSPPLQEATAQEACVDGQAKADFTANTAHSAFGVCKEKAQDECPNWPGPPSSIMTRCLAQMWAEGPPPAGTDNHWLNMSNAKYTMVACGFFQTPSGTWWATQDFW